MKGVKIEPAAALNDYRRALHNQWGLSLLSRIAAAAEQRGAMLDFGYTPDALLNNMEMTGVDPKKIEALIVSHGHFDHFGGLIGFLDKFRNVLPADLTLYAGGEDNFCIATVPSAGRARPARSRIGHARPARARQAQRQDRAGRKPGRRRPRLHHRQDQAHQQRTVLPVHSSNSP